MSELISELNDFSVFLHIQFYPDVFESLDSKEKHTKKHTWSLI